MSVADICIQRSPHSSVINLIGFANAPANDVYSARLKLVANYCLWVVVVVPFTMQHPIYFGCTNSTMSTSMAKHAIMIQLQWCESADLNLMLTWARKKTTNKRRNERVSERANRKSFALAISIMCALDPLNTTKPGLSDESCFSASTAVAGAARARNICLTVLDCLRRQDTTAADVK